MTNQESIERLCDRVVTVYKVQRQDVTVVFAPYRICPLGAHIDHQLGRVTAMALDRGTLLAFAPQTSPEVRMRSLDFEGEVCVPLGNVAAKREGDWGNYLRGAVRALQQRQPLRTGLVGVTAGRVAEGGLSSSAAVGVAYLLALQHVNQLQLTPEENVSLVQQIENDYLGLRIGILDQSAILFSRQHCLTLIHCASVAHELIPQPAGLPPFQILIAFSGLRKALTGTDYNRRVGECTEAARLLLQAADRPSVQPVLGNVTAEEYRLHGDRLSGAPARRASHFFSELRRVDLGTGAWRRGDLQEFGRLITESGASSIANYECGAPPLVDLYRTLVETDGTYGARFSGAGFRGCCLALVRPEQAEEAAIRVRATYVQQHPELASCAWTMLCQAGDGAHLIP